MNNDTTQDKCHHAKEAIALVHCNYAKSYVWLMCHDFMALVILKMRKIYKNIGAFVDIMCLFKCFKGKIGLGSEQREKG